MLLCSKCKQKKNPKRFKKDIRYKRGYASWCLDCRNEGKRIWYRRNLTVLREVSRKRAKAYRDNNPEYKLDFQRGGKYRYWQSIYEAKRKKITWQLTKSRYELLTLGPCEYCMRPLNPYGIGLDRMDCALGYIDGNCVPCCLRCNRVKGDHFTYEQMKRLGEFIRLNIDA